MARTTKQSVAILLLSWLAYLASYLGRSNYGACLLEIVAATSITRAAAGMVSSAFALCNAVGQLAVATVVRKLSPIRLIGLELFGVALINLVFPSLDSIGPMMLLWGLNGALQATLLSGLTVLFLDSLNEPWLSRGTVLLNTVGAVGGMINYLCAPILIGTLGWRSVFYTVFSVLGAMLVLWYMLMPRLTAKTEKRERKRETAAPNAPPRIGYGLASAALLSLVVGMMRESVTLWLPSYLHDSFAIGAARATTLTALIPMLQILGAFFAGWIGRRTKNIFLPTALFFLLSALSFGMIHSGAPGMSFTVCLFVLNAIAMTGALTVLLSVYPIRHIARAKIAGVVAMLNFFVHLGDFVASTGYGWLSTLGGWSLSLSVMMGLALFAATIALLGLKTGNKRRF